MRRTSSWFAVALASLLLAGSGCDPTDPVAVDAGVDAGADAGADAGVPEADQTISATIGFLGGSLTLPDGATLTVPVGALATDVAFTLSRIPGSEGQPHEYALQPTGTTFGRRPRFAFPSAERRVPRASA